MTPLNTNLSQAASKSLYRAILNDEDEAAEREHCQRDLFYLLYVALRRPDLDHPWLYARCREVEAEPDGYLDLWAREHYKSTIITYALTIQDILRDPEVTFGIFSHTRPKAKDFLTQIKHEFETNTYLKTLFPDILYSEPEKQSPCWSIDRGITVKRKTNPAAATVEAYGLVDGMPTGKHYRVLVYDDVVTDKSVYTTDQIKNTTKAWELSLNLGSRGGRRRMIGTTYHYADTYRTIKERNAAIPRIYTATDDGTMKGNPVLLTKEELQKKYTEMGVYTAGAQLFMNPTMDSAMGFNESWLKYYDRLKDTTGWNIYILVDPANAKKKDNDYTVMTVIGLAPDRNYYLLDGLRDRLNLVERTNKLFAFVRKWKPLKVGYETYGMQCDIEHIEKEMENVNYRFRIIPVGGSMPKHDRIRKLVSVFENGRMIFPHRLLFSDYQGKLHDFIREFIEEEYIAFPVSLHDDMLDDMSRIVLHDLGAIFPDIQEDDTVSKPKPYDPLA